MDTRNTKDQRRCRQDRLQDDERRTVNRRSGAAPKPALSEAEISALLNNRKD